MISLTDAEGINLLDNDSLGLVHYYFLVYLMKIEVFRVFHLVDENRPLTALMTLAILGGLKPQMTNNSGARLAVLVDIPTREEDILGFAPNKMLQVQLL